MIKLITYPNSAGLFIILLFLILFTFASIAYTNNSDIDRIQKSISWLLQEAPNRPLAKDKEKQYLIAKEISINAEKYRLDPFLLISIIYHESSFKPNAQGKIGELGLVQVHGMAANGCDLSTVAGQIECGAKYLRSRIDYCGSVRGGLAAYAAGRCSAKYGKRLYRIIEKRLRLATRLKKINY